MVQGLDPNFDPLNVVLGLLLPVLEDSVGVELGRLAHFLDKGGRGRGNSHPA